MLKKQGESKMFKSRSAPSPTTVKLSPPTKQLTSKTGSPYVTHQGSNVISQGTSSSKMVTHGASNLVHGANISSIAHSSHVTHQQNVSSSGVSVVRGGIGGGGRHHQVAVSSSSLSSSSSSSSRHLTMRSVSCQGRVVTSGTTLTSGTTASVSGGGGVSVVGESVGPDVFSALGSRGMLPSLLQRRHQQLHQLMTMPHRCFISSSLFSNLI